jgi:hypothetical protein
LFHKSEDEDEGLKRIEGDDRSSKAAERNLHLNSPLFIGQIPVHRDDMGWVTV